MKKRLITMVLAGMTLVAELAGCSSSDIYYCLLYTSTGRRLPLLMEYYSSQISQLIEELSHLPGIGGKSAQRLAFHIINEPVEQVQRLADVLVNARKNVRYCKECCTLTDQELCPICASKARNHKVIMVVENSRDLAAYEKTGKFDGVYHVPVSYTHLDVYKRQLSDGEDDVSGHDAGEAAGGHVSF